MEGIEKEIMDLKKTKSAELLNSSLILNCLNSNTSWNFEASHTKALIKQQDKK